MNLKDLSFFKKTETTYLYSTFTKNQTSGLREFLRTSIKYYYFNGRQGLKCSILSYGNNVLSAEKGDGVTTMPGRTVRLGKLNYLLGYNIILCML